MATKVSMGICSSLKNSIIYHHLVIVVVVVVKIGRFTTFDIQHSKKYHTREVGECVCR